MPRTSMEDHYYQAMREGLDLGYRLTGEEVPKDLAPDVEQSLRRSAKRQAAQLRTIIVEDPKQRARIAAKVDTWLTQSGPLKLSDLTQSLAPDFGAARALRLARTETAWAMNNSAAAAAKSAGWERVTWLAALDACETCAELNGKVMDMDEYTENSVAHPNCRCSFTVYEEEGAEDADLDEAADAGGVAPGDLGAGDLDRDLDLNQGAIAEEEDPEVAADRKKREAARERADELTKHLEDPERRTAAREAYEVAIYHGDPIPKTPITVAKQKGGAFAVHRSNAYSGYSDIQFAEGKPANMDKWYKENWVTTPNPIFHELGHEYHFRSNPRTFGMRSSKRFALLRDKVKAEVGGYAASNHVEFVAEVHAAKRYSGKVYSQEIEDLYNYFTEPD